MELTYELVDDVAFAAKGGRARLEEHIASSSPVHLGPLIEYAWLRRTLSLPSLQTARKTDASEAFRCFAGSGRTRSPGSLNDGSPIGFSFVPTTAPEFSSPAWTAFKSRMMFAAKDHGFNDSQAAGLVGALEEMASNAFEHSLNSQTAIAGFRNHTSMFEFTVADVGVGALASLRSCPLFQHVHDAGEALKLCISDGVSRHGAGQGRGLGFGVLFARLADLNARVRIRSDDQVIDLRGDRVGTREAVPSGRVPMRGMVVSTQCFPLA